MHGDAGWRASRRANLFSAPESVDGLFWTVTGAGRLHVLPIVGVRPDRPGFGTLSMPDAPLAHAESWVHASVRDPGPDYASRLPGADLDALYAFEAAGEVLKLLARFFAYVGSTPTALEVAGISAPHASPRSSSLAYTRVRQVA